MVVFLFLISIFSLQGAWSVESSLPERKEKFQLTCNSDLRDFQILFPQYEKKIEKFASDLSTTNVKEKKNKLKSILRVVEKEKNKFKSLREELKTRLFFLEHVVALNRDLENYIFRIIKKVKGSNVKSSTFLRSNYQGEMPDHIMGRLGIRDNKENSKIAFSRWQKNVETGNLQSYGHWVEHNSPLEEIILFNKNIRNRKIESLYSPKKILGPLDFYLREGDPKSEKLLYNIDCQGNLLFGFSPKHPLFLKGFNHSHIANNFQVLCAGTLQLDKNNRIKHIDNQSGHYKPKEQQFQEALKLLLNKNPEIFSKNCQVFIQGASKPFNTLQEFLKKEFQSSFVINKPLQDLLIYLDLFREDASKMGLKFEEEILGISANLSSWLSFGRNFNSLKDKELTINELYQKLKIMDETLKLKNPNKSQKQNFSFFGLGNFSLLPNKIIDDFIEKIFIQFPDIMNEKEENRREIIRAEILKIHYFSDEENFVDAFLDKLKKIFSDKNLSLHVNLGLFTMYKKFGAVLSKNHF